MSAKNNQVKINFCSEILEYMKKYVNEYIINILFIQQGLISNKNNKLFSNITEYKEDLIINDIQKYLSGRKYENNGFKDISYNLYPKFIENDDKELLKLIKRLLIIYKRCHSRLLCRMLHKWKMISYNIQFNLNNELKYELEEPEIEKNPKIYSKIMKEENVKDKKRKKIKKYKNERDDNNSLIKNKTFDELSIGTSFKNINENIEKENKDIKKQNKLKKISLNENENINAFENDNIINNKENNSNNKSDKNSNYNIEMYKSKSVDKFKNIGFKVEKPKKWEYSYFRKEKENNENKMKKIKSKKKLMTNIERQQLFNNLYNDCQKRREKFRQLKIEKEAQFNTLYTFTPKIFQNKLNEKYMKNMADSKFFNTKSNSIIDNTDNNIIINNTITSSNIGNNFKEKYEENKTEFQLNFISRLSEYEKIKKQNLEKIRNEIYIDYKNTNKNRKSYDKILNNHLLNNSENFLEIKQKNIEKIKQDMYNEQGITFQPKTNKMFNNKIKNDIIERNKEFIKEKQEKLERYSHMKEKECTFKPKINNIEVSNIKEKNKKHNISYKTEQNSSDVSKRLFDYQKKYKDNLEDIKSKYKESYSFNPIISKNTNSILNNRQKMKEKFQENTYIENTNYELLKKQIKLGELEELSKKLEEIKNDNLEIKENNPTKKISNNKEVIIYQDKINKNIQNNKDIFNNNNENSNKIMELANNLININNNKILQQEKILDKKENTNDFILLMNNKNKNSLIQRNFDFDYDKGRGGKQIMNLNYYNNLL